MPNLYIIAGCNGAGKTTASYTVLPEMLNCKEFVNADEIAKGLSPFQPETVSFQAGRIMLNRIRELIDEQVDFAFETTLSTKSYIPLIKKAKAQGYSIVLFFFWLESPELAQERVKDRVFKGGHSIPNEVVIRRYYRGLKNLFKMIPISDNWIVANNSGSIVSVIADGKLDIDCLVYNNEIWNKINSLK
jgi:predicted ABC-type ATPase